MVQALISKYTSLLGEMISSSLLIITGKLTVALARLKYRHPLAKILPEVKTKS